MYEFKICMRFTIAAWEWNIMCESHAEYVSVERSGIYCTVNSSLAVDFVRVGTVQ